MALPNDPRRHLTRTECLANARTILGYPDKFSDTLTGTPNKFTLFEVNDYNRTCAELAQAWIALADRVE